MGILQRGLCCFTSSAHATANVNLFDDAVPGQTFKCKSKSCASSVFSSGNLPALGSGRSFLSGSCASSVFSSGSGNGQELSCRWRWEARGAHKASPWSSWASRRTTLKALRKLEPSGVNVHRPLCVEVSPYDARSSFEDVAGAVAGIMKLVAEFSSRPPSRPPSPHSRQSSRQSSLTSCRNLPSFEAGSLSHGARERMLGGESPPTAVSSPRFASPKMLTIAVQSGTKLAVYEQVEENAQPLSEELKPQTWCETAQQDPVDELEHVDVAEGGLADVNAVDCVTVDCFTIHSFEDRAMVESAEDHEVHSFIFDTR